MRNVQSRVENEKIRDFPFDWGRGSPDGTAQQEGLAAVSTTSCQLRVPVAGTRRRSAASAKEEEARNNQLTCDVRRCTTTGARSRDRRARGRQRAPAGKPMARVTTLGSCSGRTGSAAAATTTERRHEAAACQLSTRHTRLVH